jgi:hypothetical protein
LLPKLLFPRHVGFIVAERIEAWMQDIRRLAFDSFAGDGETSAFDEARTVLTSSSSYPT